MPSTIFFNKTANSIIIHSFILSTRSLLINCVVKLINPSFYKFWLTHIHTHTYLFQFLCQMIQNNFKRRDSLKFLDMGYCGGNIIFFF